VKLSLLVIHSNGGSFAAPETMTEVARNACGMHSKWNSARAGYPEKQSQKTSSH
jgi:hypothetical protein